MVSGLIEKEDVGSFESELSEHDSIPQTVGKLSDRRSLVRSRDTESTDARPPELNVLVRVLRLELGFEVFERGLVVRKLVGGMLRVLGEFESRVSLNSSGDRLEVGSDQVEEGRLSGTVLSDDSDTRVHAVNTNFHISF